MCIKEGGKAVTGKCKWEMKVISQMGSKGEEGNATGRICCWVLREEPGFGNGLFSLGFGLPGWCPRSTHSNPAPASGGVSKCKAKGLSTGRISPQCPESP